MPPAQINLARVVPRTRVEGPGLRFAVWVQGCPLRCRGCCNPDLLEAHPGEQVITPDALAQEVLGTEGIEGITLLGGEPFAQASPLASLAAQARAAGLGVITFTGYTLEQLRAGEAGQGGRALLDATDALVDGPYQQALRTTQRRFIGSQNQRLHDLTGRYRRWAEEDRRGEGAGNQVEIRLSAGRITVNGFPVGGPGGLGLDG